MPPAGYVASTSPDETLRLGEALGAVLAGGDVVALSGELGVGKTCFTQGIARGLGIDPRVPVTSPTFTLMGEYPGRLVLRHADFYRVERYSRLEAAGFEDALDEHGVLVVEWAERYPDALPAARLEIEIKLESDQARRFYLNARGSRAEDLARSLLESCP